MKKDIIIEIALEILDSRGTSQAINLREIARIGGFKHTNIYNYFDSLEALLWEVQYKVLENEIKYIMNNIVRTDRESYMKSFFSAIFDYFDNRKGQYWIIWFDNISGESPDKNEEERKKIGRILVEIISLFSENKTEHELFEKVGLIHSYFHGEFSKYLSGRTLNKDSIKTKEFIIDMVYRLANSVSI